MDNRYIKKIVSLALAEDIGIKDITTNALVPKAHQSSAQIIVKSNGIICGLAFARETFVQLSSKIHFEHFVKDGQKAKSGKIIARIHGPTRALLTGERVALNFLSYFSAIATKTHAFVDAVKPHKAIILDTRKTTPLLRPLERYAMRCGGGVNHRLNLSDMAMIKDNHRAFVSGRMNLIQAVETVRKKTKKLVELEVDTLNELKEALKTTADIILLDNMSTLQIHQAVKMRDRAGSGILLEASGGIDLKNVHRYAATGVERISVGGLTHSRQSLDISLELCP